MGGGFSLGLLEQDGKREMILVYNSLPFQSCTKLFLIFLLNSLNQQLTIAPFLPFQKEDLKSILSNNIQLLNRKYQDIHWKRLHLSNTALDYFLSTDHVEYFDLFGKANDSTTLTFSLRGATSLQKNALVQTLRRKLMSGVRRRPYKVAFVDVTASRDEKWETVLAWCDDESFDNCEEEWRFFLE
jgi:hypothetical protein